MSRISLRAVPFDDPDARTLVTELYTDQLTRYDHADPPDDDPSDYAYPRDFSYVRPEHQGQGHGRRIRTALEDHAHTVSATRILLETGVRNEAAIALFHSAGYTPIPGYVPSRDQHINRAFTKPLLVSQRL